MVMMSRARMFFSMRASKACAVAEQSASFAAAMLAKSE
jgi:hypothetical protein